MKSLTYVEIDLKRCALNYGEAPCTAALGTPEEVESGEATGIRKCFNCAADCQDLENLDEETVTLRFALDTGYLPREIEAIPSLIEDRLSPAKVSLGEDLGVRAQLDLTFRDHPHGDTGPIGDKYPESRDYAAYERGTFWGRFRARYPFIRGRAIRLIQGYVPAGFVGDYPQGLPLPTGVLLKQDTRHFVAESTTGPVPEGTFNIVAHDELKKLDGDRAQVPKPSEGRLLADIAADAVSLMLTPTGAGNLDYPRSGHVTIGGREVVLFERDPDNGLNANTQLLLKFNGTHGATAMPDSSGNGRNGTAQGHARLTTARKPFGTAALILDGDGDYVTVPDNTAWHHGNTNPFTEDIHISPDEIAGTQSLICHSSNSLTNYRRLYITAAGAVGFEVVSSGVALLSLVSPDGVVEAQKFQHISIERTAAHLWNIRVDGVTVASTTANISIPNYSSTLRIGTNGNASGDFFKGALKEARIQNAVFWGADFPDSVPAGYTNLGPDGLSIFRAQKETVAQAHNAQDRVQLMKSYVAADPADVLADLANNYADIGPALTPVEQWRIEIASYLGILITADIAEPTAVKKIWEEIVKDFSLCVWTDETVPEIRLRVLREVQAGAVRYDESNYIERSLRIAEQPEKRRSSVWTYYGKRSPIEGEEEPKNYRAVVVRVTALQQALNEPPSIEKIFSRWIPASGRPIAENVSEVRLSRYEVAPRLIEFDLSRAIARTPVLGESCHLACARAIQDATGGGIFLPLQNTSIAAKKDRFSLAAEEMRGGAQIIDQNQRRLFLEGDRYNINVRAEHDLIYPALTDEDVANGVSLTVIVVAGARVGSIATTIAALDFGDGSSWPEGLPITLEIRGLVLGKGGDGGNGVYLNGMNGVYTNGNKNGQNGGPAIRTRVPIVIKVIEGGKAGGGGGGGGGAENPIAYDMTGGCGGGGGGFNPGAIGNYRTNSAEPGTDLLGGRGGNSQWNSGSLYRGGKGGDIGQNGSNGFQVNGTPVNTTPGNAGAVIDGISYCTIEEGDADILGPRIN